MNESPNASQFNQESKESLEKNFLTFKVANKNFAIELLRVQEIKEASKTVITQLVDTSNYLVGIIHLQNQIVPIIDLRILYDAASGNNSDFDIIIIANSNDKMIGLQVDGVSDIIPVVPKDIKLIPKLKRAIEHPSLQEVAVYKDQLLMIINLEYFSKTHSECLERHLINNEEKKYASR